MNEKYDYLKGIRQTNIDPAQPSSFYLKFIDYFDHHVKMGHIDTYTIDHYIRYCCTVKGINKIYDGIKSLDICETGSTSIILSFLEEMGASIHNTKSDLRYEIDQPTELFDLVLSLEVIEHIKDHEASDTFLFNCSGTKRYTEEMRRITKRDARIIITTPNPNSILCLEKLLNFEAPYIFRPHVREYTKVELESFFPDCRTEYYETNFCFYHFHLNNQADPISALEREWPGDNRGDDHLIVFQKHG
jgi:SAM-dependent methyltransferase